MSTKVPTGKLKGLKTSDFDYDLPKELIAQDPSVPRDHSRLLVYDTERDLILERKFYEIGEFLGSGDRLVVNASRVVPARIIFREGDASFAEASPFAEASEDGSGDRDGAPLGGVYAAGEREIFLLRKVDEMRWRVLVRPGKVFKVGRRFKLGGNLSFEVDCVLDDGSRILKFFVSEGLVLDEELEKLGQTPLPLYITDSHADPEQYQTVYAKSKGSVAAPTAGLHFTEDLISSLVGCGVFFDEVILHVGRGTFLPVKTENLEEHVMHSEVFEMPCSVSERLNARDPGSRIVAVGTTSVRVLESSFDLDSTAMGGCSTGAFHPLISETDLFIYPGRYEWKAVDCLITNFHLPKSTLLMLVASFLENKGVQDPVAKLLEIYEFAKRNRYRFYSFGDAMMII